ncbi:uncharacterized protein LACBIDRAFT_301904 [Laccaria bicolor S238N-H82]|uniref:Predicted protein n=1 Tax=Laccaria bicolor (strain S238N-H82 / ATCC MYA-4686) TaxID=486041 RepID=B0CPV8_LACBS|nr:uncharacterized protein LACBIDRAFT_301904 [Laccaria bicolor S238N-H82]EDR16131.1 predicted protein [Laccaria bicolor S238N-H82]|eukprot:XP_001874339.1 predicted protein [Laccaria bicolor S238N-H82]
MGRRGTAVPELTIRSWEIAFGNWIRSDGSYQMKLQRHSTFPMRSRHSVKCAFKSVLPFPGVAGNWSGQNDVNADAHVELDGEGSCASTTISWKW